MKQLLKTLTEIFGPSGYEDAIRKVVLKEVRSIADDVRVDALGSVIAHKKPAKSARDSKKIMLAAHMDEIGVIVSHVDKNGFVRFTNIGGTFGRYTAGARVRFLNGVGGVVGYDRSDEIDKLVSINGMFIDVGASSQEDCPVKVGELACFERPFVEMGDRWVAKSLDDRAGVTVLIETLRSLKSTQSDLYFVFTTQEEVGMRGAGPAAFGVDPDIGIAVDVTPTGDTPGSLKMLMELGRGPAIKFRDVGMLADPRVVDWMINRAEKARIPYQREVLLVGSTDAREMQITRAGVMTGALSIPLRYVHSSSEMVDQNDLKNSVKLLTALLSKPVAF